MQLLIDPCQQTDRGIGEVVAQCLRFRALFPLVTAAVGHEPVRSLVPIDFSLSVGREGVFGGFDRVGEEARGVTPDHVYVGGGDVGGVQETHYAGYHGAPVAALSHCVEVGRMSDNCGVVRL